MAGSIQQCATGWSSDWLVGASRPNRLIAFESLSMHMTLNLYPPSDYASMQSLHALLPVKAFLTIEEDRNLSPASPAVECTAAAVLNCRAMAHHAIGLKLVYCA